MKTKQIDLIKILLENPSNAARLSDILDVSIRTIRTYVKQINEVHDGMIISSQDGYTVNRKLAFQALQTDEKRLPQTKEERVSFIITQLLNVQKNKSVCIFDLEDELFVSESTMRKDLKSIARKLKKMDLELVFDKDSIIIQGLEKNKRKLLSTLLYEESNINFVNMDSLQKAFYDVDIEHVKNVILRVLDDNKYFINDYSLINLVLHITIAVDRIMNDSVHKILIDTIPKIDIHEFILAQEICKDLGTYFNIEFNEIEINDIALLIASRTTPLDYENIKKTDIESIIGKETFELVNELIGDINAFFHVNLLEDDFLVRFALHIRSLLIRGKNNQFSKNPLSYGIKKSSPLIYESSVKLASTLKYKTGLEINDDEIAYIAFHIGSAIKAVESLKEKVRIVYYCPNYLSSQDLVTQFIKNYFDNDIIITSIITDESQINTLRDADFILSYLPITVLTMTPIIEISPFPSDNDRHMLSDIVRKVRKNKEKKQFEEHLRTLISKEKFEVNTTILESKSCIEHMSGLLIRDKYVNGSFTQEVLEREELSSTAFNGAAIPHSMYMNAEKTAISILLNPKGIEWGPSIVNIVIMMCFNKNERYIFNEIFEPITLILSNENNLHELINCTNYETFIKQMVDFI